ncbi:DNA-binding transcriptional regulator, MarR family [Mucilaginibacter gossypiicola]|uniref:DNA-binding transcriptional regulator, MarR family n=1 Tax=Mucilaginibacter gossypiicola TaxID=551995 RepID=A0A1H7ZWG7_9SPHI|nr:MarR family winged helix-turn-helix transcriptional regulator [Mucilaginibacter gossypiicola]SEM61657.1 DNA-binding transcriptional regulator, MarR family [Mucilaginibacter gossypiicola]
MKNIQLISKRLKKINYLYTKMILNELSPFELDHHFEVLLTLAVEEKQITQNRLSELLQIDKSRTAVIVFDLEKRGLVSININPEDRRRHYISLSPLAKSFIPHIELSVEKINQLAGAGIEQQKLMTFFEVSEMIQHNLVNKLSC